MIVTITIMIIVSLSYTIIQSCRNRDTNNNNDTKDRHLCIQTSVSIMTDYYRCKKRSTKKRVENFTVKRYRIEDQKRGGMTLGASVRWLRYH